MIFTFSLCPIALTKFRLLNCAKNKAFYRSSLSQHDDRIMCSNSLSYSDLVYGNRGALNTITDLFNYFNGLSRFCLTLSSYMKMRLFWQWICIKASKHPSYSQKGQNSHHSQQEDLVQISLGD